MSAFGFRLSAGLLLDATHAIVIDNTDAYICTRTAATTEVDECDGLILPGQLHIVVTINGHPLLRWCRSCAPGIVGRAFYDWMDH